MHPVKALKPTAICRLTPRGIAIDLRVGHFRPRLVVIDIPFDEIDELAKVTYVEAACNPQIGPNENDVRDCVRGRIPRPTMLPRRR